MCSISIFQRYQFTAVQEWNLDQWDERIDHIPLKQSTVTSVRLFKW